MNWTQWLTYDPYKKLWSLLGGRPWTYISRDLYHKVEYLVLVSLFTSGFALGQAHLVNWRWFLILIITYTIGFVHGHFFWGKDYIENQEGD